MIIAIIALLAMACCSCATQQQQNRRYHKQQSKNHKCLKDRGVGNNLQSYNLKKGGKK